MSVSGPMGGKPLPRPVRLVKYALAALFAAALVYLVVVEMSWPQQAVLAGVLMLLAFALDRSSKSYLVTLTMMGMSLFATCRYGYWRLHNVALFFTDARSRWGWLDAVFILMLVSAEVYAFVILVLGYVQTVWPLRRSPAPLPDDPATWPEIDLLIPTYNEPLGVVRYTALAALNLDWPPEKLHVYILDDGRREEFQTFAAAANVGYVTRTGNQGAKAGNINHALKTTRSPYVAIFDCDHVPTRSFLQVTVGWFLRDQKLGMLQTPHHFYSPDPFERNLGQFRTIPNEGELFYGIVQDGNDFWNAAFFCGSCAVLRRAALTEIGGIATATVTEDAHTSLLIQKNGWNTAYINVPQAAGLATESLSGHVSQRVRWARGMVQILRLDNPLFARGLSLPQRLCYFNAMMHFMYALPRLIFLTAPLLYLIFSRSNVPGYWAAILAFALPHLVLSSSTNSRIQGMHRHSFWNEIYETVLAPYILFPTIMAFINPKLGKFNVTAKGGVVKESYFDHRIAYPFVFLLAINLLGLVMAIPRLIYIPGLHGLWDGRRPGTIGMNCAWTLFNIVIVSVATGVARESQQRRGQVRITMESPVSVMLPNDLLAPGDTTDVSSSGVRVQLAEAVELAPGQEVQIMFALREGKAALPVVVIGGEGNELRLQFGPLTLDQQAQLTEAIYSRADSWLGWGEAREADRPLRSLARILRLSVQGFGIALGSLVPHRSQPRLERTPLASRISCFWAAALLLPGVLGWQCRGARLPIAPPQPVLNRVGTGVSPYLADTRSNQFSDQFTLRDIGVPDPILLYGRVNAQTVSFSLPPMELTQKASLHLYYHLASHHAGESLRVLLNGTEVTTLTAPAAADRTKLLEQEVSLPAELLVHQNQITFALSGEPPGPCRLAENLQPEGIIDPQTRLVLSGSLLAIANDLLRLPLPFLDPSSFRRSSLPVVFAGPPSHAALEAAGILASYFGMLAGDHQVLFPVSIGKLPAGNAILIVEDPGLLPAGLDISGTRPLTPPWAEDAIVAIRPNPADPASKLLVLAANRAAPLVMAAQAVALRSPLLTADAAAIGRLTLPRTRQPDDAPRWSQTDRPVALVDAANSTAARDPSMPVNVYLRLPPDLAYLNRPSVPLALEYRYNQVPLNNDSAAQVVVNQQYVGATLLPSGRNPAKIVHRRMELETSTLRPFSNSLSMSFAFRFAHRQLCQGSTPAGMTAALLTGSQLDLRGIPHWATLPDLELLANAGFPFTRYADLDRTTVVLPSHPAAAEIALYLMLMGHFAAQTGYPALRVRLDDSAALHAGNDRDLLVIGSFEQGEDTIAGLAALLPLSFDGNQADGDELEVLRPERFFSGMGEKWGKILGRITRPADTGPDHFSVMPDALIAGLESPYAAGHSLVLILMPAGVSAAGLDAGSGAGAHGWMDDFLKLAQSSAVSGSLSIAQDGKFYSYHLAPGSYHVGRLSWRLQADRWLTEVPWSVPGAVVACCLPLAFWTRGWLVRRAADRLHGLER